MDKRYSENSNTENIIESFLNTCIPVMTKLNIQQPLLRFSVTRDPLEILLICRFEFSRIIKKKNYYKCCVNGKMFVSGFFDE